MKGIPSWNGLNFIQQTVHLQELNPLQAQFTVLCNTIQHKQKISKHLGKNIEAHLNHQPSETVEFLFIQIHETASSSRTELGNSEEDKLLKVNLTQCLV